MDNLKNQLLTVLTAESKKRQKWERVDFMTSQVLTWVAIVTSFVASISAAYGEPKLLTVILAGLSGTLILIDKNFTFSKRATWNSQYRIEIDNLLRELEFKTSEEVSKNLHDLQLTMERSFPNADFKLK